MVCFDDGSSVKLRSFKTAKNTKPTLEALANGYTLKSAYKTNNNNIICKFTRTVTVPSGSESLMHDANAPLHMLYAHGDYSSGSIQYHGGSDEEAFITKDKVNLVPASVSKLFVFSLKTDIVLTVFYLVSFNCFGY